MTENQLIDLGFKRVYVDENSDIIDEKLVNENFIYYWYILEIEKYFWTGKKINYDKEIDWKAISNHKKQMWYDSQNFQIQAGNEYSKRQG